MYDSIKIENIIRQLAEHNARLDSACVCSIETVPGGSITHDVVSIVATQCLVCGHVEAPNPDLLRCPSCGQIGTDVHAFAAVEVS